MRTLFALLWITLALTPQTTFAQFDRIVLDEQFHSEGAAIADINGDGHADVISGPYWYAGPNFNTRTAYQNAAPYPIANYSGHFFTYAHDFNNDERPDLLVIPMPGDAAYWYENPGSRQQLWKRHLALKEVSNESPLWADLTGDHKPELICISAGAYGYASPNPETPYEEWTFTPITPNKNFGRFTHGLGIGDVNKDSRWDLLEKDGWWEQTEVTGELFQFHAYPFAQSGGSQMFAYDFDGDGDNDVLSVQNAHGYGLKWFEQRRTGNDIGFVPHVILPDQEQTATEISLSQMHAVALIDVDNDGIKDIVTGKRFYAHGGKDPGAYQLPATYWFRTVRIQDHVHFEPSLIDPHLGVGTQLTTGDLNKDGRPDLVIANKLGTSVVLNQATASTKLSLTDYQKLVGTNQYTQAIRTTEALTPEEELETFVLPHGFEASLVISEPHIAKPMNMAFDKQGRLWVSSSEEYPYAADEKDAPKDKILLLEDTNQDGQYEKVTTFADGLNIPMGLYPYKQGVVCFSIPNILYLADTDGDGKADQRTVLYGPFGFEKDTHGLCNGFTRGYDGWLYACHGFNNQTQVSGPDGNTVTMHSGNTFRFRLDGSRIEHFTHGLVNPFGMSQSPLGDLFVADCHTKPINLLIPNGYYQSFGKPHDGLGYVPDLMSHLHGSTAIGGITQYSASKFPKAYHGNLFGGNVMTGRVIRNSLHQHNGGYKAQEEPDLLISGDPWFRPVDLQLGPGGAIYVADFYNKIIGHYEVELSHPGRDRHRGRIWKIQYTGAKPQATETSPENALTISQAFDHLNSDNQTLRMAALDFLSDDCTAEAVTSKARKLLKSNPPMQRACALWILQRHHKLTDQEVLSALADSSDLVQIHACRMMRERTSPHFSNHLDLFKSLIHKQNLVARVAIETAALSPSLELCEVMLGQLQSLPDPQSLQRHALRMSIRDHLKDDALYQQLSMQVDDSLIPELADLSLALQTPQSGQFIASHLQQLTTSEAGKLKQYVQFAARYVEQSDLPSVIAIIQNKFASHKTLQLEYLQSIREGFLQRGRPVPEDVRQWAIELASAFMGLVDGELPPATPSPISWHALSLDGVPQSNPTFSVTHRRSNTLGEKNIPLFSSIPEGEQKTGRYVSDPFQVEKQFHFNMAGHHGYPDEAPHKKNYVRLKDAHTQQTLSTWYPPRNDTAHPYLWETDRPREVQLEIVDGDTAGAYAWLAVGQFSIDSLNPSNSNDHTQLGVELIGNLQLVSLQNVLQELLKRYSANPQQAAQVATALAKLKGGGLNQALAISIGFTEGTNSQRSERIEALLNSSAERESLLGHAMKSATLTNQNRIARELCSDAQGTEILLKMLEQGTASLGILRSNELRDLITVSAQDSSKQRLHKLLSQLPDESQEIAELLTKRQQDFRTHGGNPLQGQTLFQKNCQVCHQVAGKGTAVGPNLDGLGNRGLERLVEDILAPNRNVDVAFQTTTLVTIDGKVYNGLSKGNDGQRLVLIDSRGEKISVPLEDIEEQVISRRSPMPESFATQLTEAQFRDLVAWLLTLRH